MTAQQNASGQSPLAKKTKQPRQVERFIRERDAFKLEWYFGEAKSTFSRSIFGAMLTRADLYRHGTYPCFRCQGTPGINPETGAWCQRCKGTGFFSFENYSGKDAVTAFPTQAVQEAGGYEPSHVVLQLYGKIARRLDVVAARGETFYPRVLERYHGDEGARWGRTPEGRIFAVVPETPAGNRLLMRVTKPGELEMTPAERVAAEVKTEKRQPKAWRRELLRLARKQAEDLYGDAAHAWNMASFFLKAQRSPNPPPSMLSAVPPSYITVRETIDREASGNILPKHGGTQTPVDVSRASGKQGALEYETAEEPCRAPRCNRMAVAPFVYCYDHQEHRRPAPKPWA